MLTPSPLQPVVPSAEDELASARAVVQAGAAALAALAESLDHRVLLAADLLVACRGRVVVSGLGKSGIAARKIAATLASLGTPSLFLHAADALHGDLGKMTEGDVLLAISVSGETDETNAVAAQAASLAVPVIVITVSPHSRMAAMANELLLLPETAEGGPIDVAPMASTAMTMAMGDVLATLVAERRRFSRSALARLHPAGRIGIALRPVARIMHGGERMPLVSSDAGIDHVVDVIDHKGMGIAGVVNESGQLVGVITDGDLRHQFRTLSGKTAHEVMTDQAVTVPPTCELQQALALMRERRIAALFVIDVDRHHPVGIVHLQDLLRHGLG